LKRSPEIFLPSVVKVQEALLHASSLLDEKGFSAPRLDAEVLLAHLLKVRKVDLYLDHMRPLCEKEAAAYESLIQRRLEGEPVAHITGEKEFWSLPFTVNSSCLIPRPETEILVEKALEICRTGDGARSSPYRILDLGTGCGAIAVCLAREIPHARVTATDISRDALAVARENAKKQGVSDKIKLGEGDLFDPVRKQKDYFDLIVSNPPYVAEKDAGTLPREVREYEPYTALYGGSDGLAFYRSIIPESLHFLKKEGYIALEIGYGEVDRILEIFSNAGGFQGITVRSDLSGIPRVVSAKRSGLQ